MIEEDIASLGRLGLCGECGDKPAKYRCPRCQVSSCSLGCSVRHKERLDCSGLRDKTKYVPLGQFTMTDLLSDYGLLESAARSVDSYSRDKMKNIGSVSSSAFQQNNHNNNHHNHNHQGQPWLPRHLAKLRVACSKRGNCRLTFLPPHFKRHQDNTSRYCWAQGAIEWQIQLKFPNVVEDVEGDGDGGGTFTAVTRSKDTDTVYRLLKPFLRPPDQDKRMACLDPYVSAGFSGTTVLLKNENPRFSSKRFFEMDIGLTLMENLAGKAVIEHPVIFVVLSSHSDYFLDDEEINVDDKGLKSDRLEDTRPPAFSSSCQSRGEARADEKSVSDSSFEVFGQNQGKNPSKEGLQQLDKRLLDGCYEYYLNYYKEKYGVVSSLSPSSNLAPPLKTAAETDSLPTTTLGPNGAVTRFPALNPHGPAAPPDRAAPSSSGTPGGLMSVLVDYSGSEDDEDDNV